MLYGRDEERRGIADAVAAARAGHGRALVLYGEAGIGKTALLRGIDLSGATVLRGYGTESELDLGFSGLHRLLLPVLNTMDQLSPTHHRALSRALGLAGGETTDLMVCAAVHDLISRLAVPGPLAIVVDDADYLDRASLQVLLFVARRIEHLPVVVVMSMREDAQAELSDLLRVRLRGLSSADAVRLFHERDWPMDPVLAATMVRATGGNPLALTELARLRRRDELATHALLTQTVPIEHALRELVTRQLHDLPEAARLSLQVAAAVDSTELDLVNQVCDRLDLDPVGLATIEATGLITIMVDEFWFTQALVRSAVYSGLSNQHRRRLHAVVAEVLADGGETARSRWHRALAATGPDPELAADLERDTAAITRRGGAASAVPLLQQAARISGTATERDRRTAAAAHAAWKSGHVTIATHLLANLRPDSSDAETGLLTIRLRSLLKVYNGDQTAAYEFLRHTATTMPAEFADSAAELWCMAIDAALHTGRIPDALAAAGHIRRLPVDEDLHRYGRWIEQSIQDELAEDGTEPWQISAAAPAVIENSQASRWIVPMVINRSSRHPAEAVEFGRYACEQLRLNGMLAIYPIPLPWLIELEFHYGRWDDGEALAAEGLRSAQDVGQRPRVADFAGQLALFAAVRDRPADVDRFGEQAMSAAAAVTNRLAAAYASWARGLAALAAGDFDTAAQLLAALDEIGGPAAHPQVAAQATADLVEALMRCGERDRAQRYTESFAKRVEQDSPPWMRAMAWRCRALVAEPADARNAFDEALRVEELRDRPFDHARTALLYGRFLRRERQIRAARAQLRAAAELFTTLDAPQWAHLANGELRASGGAAPHRNGPGLTAQERQVAMLAADGWTNRQIGDRLFISPRTVGYHLHKIFPKLGITSRSQLRGMDLSERSHPGGS